MALMDDDEMTVKCLVHIVLSLRSKRIFTNATVEEVDSMPDLRLTKPVAVL